MPHSHMLNAVLQAAVLSACSLIVSHHLYANAYDSMVNHEAFKAIEAAANASAANAHSTFNTTAFNGTSFNVNGTEWHVTGINQTSTTPPNSNSKEESFYWRTLPRELFLMVLICPLQYWWQIWLERTFPARRSISSISFDKSEKLHGEEDETREKEVIERWIAQGKVKRASLSWWNTFVKWFLDVTAGALWAEAARAVLERLFKLHPIRKLFTGLKWEILLNFAGSFFGLGPLASLLAIIIVPAHQRIVFKAGAELIWSIFFGSFVGVIIPWLADTQFVKDIVANVTATMNGTQNPNLQFKAEARLIDEL